MHNFTFKTTEPKTNLFMIQQVEVADLVKYPNMTVTSCGEENMYFAHDGKNYYCKCF